MQYVSLSFSEDLHRDELDAFRKIHNCMGVSAYKNTINLYFRHVSNPEIHEISSVVRRHLVRSGTDVALRENTFDSSASSRQIFAAIREEAMN